MKRFLDMVIPYLPYILLFGFVAFFGKKVINFFGIGRTSEEKKIDKGVEETKTKIAEQTKKNATISSLIAKEIANNLYYDLLENSTEDEEDAFLQIKKLKNSADWALIDASFGVRDDNAYFKSFHGTLSQAINEYVDSSYLLQIKAYLKGLGVTI